MEFDKSKVYTALNADELKPGSKVICADNMEILKDHVNYDDRICVLDYIQSEDCRNRFFANSASWNLAYLISEPIETWIVYLCRRKCTEPYLTHCRSDCWETVQKDYGAKTKLFEGTEDESDKWYEARKHFTDVIAAWEDGKTIQFFIDVTGNWEDIEEPTWFTRYQYRIKPEGLKWTDLKIGDIVHRIDTSNTNEEAIVVAIDKNPATGFHVMIANGWVADEHLSKDWGKVE